MTGIASQNRMRIEKVWGWAVRNINTADDSKH